MIGFLTLIMLIKTRKLGQPLEFDYFFNFRFGKRTVLDALLAHLLTMNVDDESIDKRAKDFLRFG